MSIKIPAAGFALTLAFSLPALSATFTPTFDTPSFPGTQFNVESDPAYNDFYRVNFGIEVLNSYLYIDPRDTLDGIGIANGTTADLGTFGISGRINFLDQTDFVEVDYASIFDGGTYSAYTATGALLDSFTSGTGTNNGSFRLDGGLIAYITFSGQGGAVGVSGLTYNYDGVTDGVNDDIEGTPVVPLPASGIMLLAAIGGMAAARGRQ
ncbi:MAG: VPLPA-CTERM sorting domain-containing protein [Pseudomonadota bacterium]